MAKSLVARVAPGSRRAELRLLVDSDHYDQLIQRELPSANVALWIATANLKELRVEAPVGTRARARGRYVSVMETIDGLANRGVDVRILHGRAPSRAFRQELGRRRGLSERVQLRECPRVHMKLVMVDGRSLYLGSANFTGAGIGARADTRRNFEVGILSEDEHLLDQLQGRFDRIWSGKECKGCGLRRECARPIDTFYGAAASSASKR